MRHTQTRHEMVWIWGTHRRDVKWFGYEAHTDETWNGLDMRHTQTRREMVWIRGTHRRDMKWFGYEAHTDETWNVYTILVWKPGRRRTSGIPTKRWVNDISLTAKWQQCAPHGVSTGSVGSSQHRLIIYLSGLSSQWFGTFSIEKFFNTEPGHVLNETSESVI